MLVSIFRPDGWQSKDFRAWVDIAKGVDPEHHHWVVGRSEGILQPLGGLLPHSLRLALAGSEARSLWALVESLLNRILDKDLPGWRDVDSAEARDIFEGEQG